MFTIPPEVRFLTGGGSTSYVLQTASFAPTSGSLNAADTTATAFTATLPSSPTVGDSIVLADAKGSWAINHLTIDPNGQLLAGASSNLLCDVANSYLQLVFVGGTTGWEIYTLAPGGGGGGIATTVLTPSSNYELPTPATTGKVAGDRAKFYITPSAGITLTVNLAIKIPSDSTFTSKVLTSGKLYIVQLEYNGTAWMLETLVGGY